jgi:hypothetical protein
MQELRTVPVYRVIYDAREASDPATLLIILALVAAGLALWATGWMNERLGFTSPGHPTKDAGRMRRAGRWMTFAALLVGGSAYWLEYSETRRLRDALDTGDYTEVEGHVREFQRGDRGGHRDERFTIVSNGRRYTYGYSYSRRVPGFHESHGPIREGLFVRIADVDGHIARLEIASQADPSTE